MKVTEIMDWEKDLGRVFCH